LLLSERGLNGCQALSDFIGFRGIAREVMLIGKKLLNKTAELRGAVVDLRSERDWRYGR
jgi:hypothetical protein